MVAGEASGDQLGAALITALEGQFPGAQFAGIGGSRMQAAGFDAWWDCEELAVMGLFEVLRDLPRLLRLRRRLRDRIVDLKPDILIGIDAPEFNLGLEKQVRRLGITTAHYVSPTVWAWRPGRARKIGASADLVLCLFPFEPAFLSEHGVAARYTGHPMADAIPLENDVGLARDALHRPREGLNIALLPGSRMAELERLSGPLLDAAEIISGRHPGSHFLVPLPSAGTADFFRQALDARKLDNVQLLDGRSIEAMTAADVVVCASGTASLECMLVNRPMVVVYRLAGMTHWVLKNFKLFKSRFFSLPNVLAGEALVPELLQDGVSGTAIADEVERWLVDPDRRATLRQRFHDTHLELRIDAATSAANAIAELMGQNNGQENVPTD
jgi:lipid-A-disaccharide synthase